MKIEKEGNKLYEYRWAHAREFNPLVKDINEQCKDGWRLAFAPQQTSEDKWIAWLEREVDDTDLDPED